MNHLFPALTPGPSLTKAKGDAKSPSPEDATDGSPGFTAKAEPGSHLVLKTPKAAPHGN